MTAPGRFEDYWREDIGGVLLRVRLTPSAGRDNIGAIESLSNGSRALRVRVGAVPEKGKANAALVRLLAKGLRVAPRAIKVVAGEKDRVKTLKIEAGAEIAAVAAGEF